MVLINVFLIISEGEFICKYLLNILISIFVKYLFTFLVGGGIFQIGISVFSPVSFFYRISLYILDSSF